MGKPGVLQSMGSQSQTLLRDGTELNINILYVTYYNYLHLNIMISIMFN